MRKGTLSLDLLVTVLVLLMLGEVFVSYGSQQAESSVARGLKFKVESETMAVGSAINNFAAIHPEEGSRLILNLSSPEPIGNNTLSGGWPKVGRVDFYDCTMAFSHVGLSNHLVMNLTYERWDSKFTESVLARYPIAGTVISSGVPFDDPIKCNGSIVLEPTPAGSVELSLYEESEE